MFTISQWRLLRVSMLLIQGAGGVPRWFDPGHQDSFSQPPEEMLDMFRQEGDPAHPGSPLGDENIDVRFCCEGESSSF